MSQVLQLKVLANSLLELSEADGGIDHKFVQLWRVLGLELGLHFDLNANLSFFGDVASLEPEPDQALLDSQLLQALGVLIEEEQPVAIEPAQPLLGLVDPLHLHNPLEQLGEQNGLLYVVPLDPWLVIPFHYDSEQLWLRLLDLPALRRRRPVHEQLRPVDHFQLQQGQFVVAGVLSQVLLLLAVPVQGHDLVLVGDFVMRLDVLPQLQEREVLGSHELVHL